MTSTFKFGTATARSMFDLPKMKSHGGRSRGRLPAGVMNKLETAYSEHLEYRRFQGEVLWWKYEGVTLKLAKDTRYTPDFAVMMADGYIELHETKGFMRDDARIKLFVAAEMFPFEFVLITARPKSDGGGWVEKRIGYGREIVPRESETA